MRQEQTRRVRLEPRRPPDRKREPAHKAQHSERLGPDKPDAGGESRSAERRDDDSPRMSTIPHAHFLTEKTEFSLPKMRPTIVDADDPKMLLSTS